MPNSLWFLGANHAADLILLAQRQTANGRLPLSAEAPHLSRGNGRSLAAS